MGASRVEPGALGHLHDLVDHLAHGLALDGQAGGRRIGHADAGIEQAQVVVDLGHRADGRARVLRRGLLLDGDRRRQALDGIHVRLLHELEELARVGRERLDVAALALGVDGVEGERRLARARQPGHHRERIPRQGHVDVFKIVLPRPTHREHGSGGSRGGIPRRAPRRLRPPPPRSRAFRVGQLGANGLGANGLGANGLSASRLGANRLGANSLRANGLGASRLGAGLLRASSLGSGTAGGHADILNMDGSDGTG